MRARTWWLGGLVAVTVAAVTVIVVRRVTPADVAKDETEAAAEPDPVDALREDADFQRGKLAMAKGDWEVAERNFVAARRAHPRDPLLFYYIGAIDAQLDRPIPALVYLGAYLKTRTDKPEEAKPDDEVKGWIRNLEVNADSNADAWFAKAIEIAGALPAGEKAELAGRAMVSEMMRAHRFDLAAKAAAVRPHGMTAPMVDAIYEMRDMLTADEAGEAFRVVEEIAVKDFSGYVATSMVARWARPARARIPDNLPEAERQAMAEMRAAEDRADEQEEQQSREEEKALGRRLEPPIALFLISMLEDRIGLHRQAYRCAQRARSLAPGRTLVRGVANNAVGASMVLPAFRRWVLRGASTVIIADDDLREVAFYGTDGGYTPPRNERDDEFGAPGWEALDPSAAALLLADPEGNLAGFTVDERGLMDPRSAISAIMSGDRYDAPGDLAKLAGRHALGLYLLRATHLTD